jgi:hypothetical protein
LHFTACGEFEMMMGKRLMPCNKAGASGEFGGEYTNGDCGGVLSNSYL